MKQNFLRCAFAATFFVPFLAVAPASAQPTPIKTAPQIQRPNPSILQLPGRYHLYQLSTPVGNAATLRSMASTFKVSFAGGDQDVQGKLMEGRITRGYIQGGSHPRMVILPEMAHAKAGQMTAEAAQAAAATFVREHKQEAGDASKFVPMKGEPWRSAQGAEGKAGPPENRMFTVNFSRKLDGMDTIGPSSVLSVQVDSRGVIGLTNALRRVAAAKGFAPKMRSQADVNRLRDEQIRKGAQMFKGSPKVLGQHIAYLDQGMRYVQPVYVWGVEYQGPVGKVGNLVMVPVFSNTPEPIMDMTKMPNMRPPGEGSPKGGEDENNFLLAALRPQANPVQIGMYVVRNDDSCWVGSAWSFWTNIVHGTGWPARNLLQYWWNHNEWWETDTRRWVAGQVHVALLEGHGAPWLITTLGNGSDVINLKNIAGFGSGMGGGEKTAYVIWHSCDVVPVPGDAHGGDFTSGSAWDVWWHLFRGMRGTYGYRTTMAICDGVCSGFGDHIGRGTANLSAWLNETGSQWWLRTWYGWDHGSAVLLSGHENDCIYDNTGGPAPGSLTMWWN